MLFKKTLVLSSTNGGNEKAVVNFEKDNGEIVGEAKLYNFKDEPDGILSLGLKEGDKVYKAGLSRIGTMKYSFKYNSILNLKEFSCAIININHGEVKSLVNGCTTGSQSTDEILAQVATEIDKTTTMQQCEKILDEHGIELDDQQEIENQIDSCMNENCSEKCSACKYRYAFYSGEEDKNNETFYDGISEDISKLFSSHTQEEFLEQIIPFSKWVKIENEDNDDYYVLGLIYENDEVKYICYGVPGMYSETPPEELKGYAEWLPLDSTKEYEFGYWITYQDAVSGDNVKADFTVV